MCARRRRGAHGALLDRLGTKLAMEDVIVLRDELLAGADVRRAPA